MSEERHFGIAREPQYTCPMIDSVIDELDSVNQNIEGFEKTKSTEDLVEMLKYVEEIVGGVSKLQNRLEEIRENVTNIRDWGEEWKRLAIKLSNELEEINNS